MKDGGDSGGGGGGGVDGCTAIFIWRCLHLALSLA